MKLYLDDMRPCPEGWTLATTENNAILTLIANKVTEISLDHDLGEGNGDGYRVICWIEHKAMTDLTYIPPFVKIHSANVAVRSKMEFAAERINAILNERVPPST